MPTIENGRDGMVSVLHPLDELAQLQDAGSIFCVTECENVTARYGRDESIGDEVRKLFDPKIVEQYEAGFEVSVKEHCKYVLVWTYISAFLTKKGRQVRDAEPLQFIFGHSSGSKVPVLDVLEAFFLVHQIGDQETVLKVRENGRVLMGECDVCLIIDG